MATWASKSRRRAFTMVEAVVGVGIGSFVMISLISFTVMVGRISKSTNSQQISLRDAKSAIEMINRQLRPAVSPVTLIDPDNDRWGNAVEFVHYGETVRRRIELHPGADGDYFTPWDNVLYYHPDVTQAAGREIIATRIAPVDPRGAFQYNGVVGALNVRMRIGDPIGQTHTYRTGVGVQGAEVNIAISPRN